MLRVVSDGTSEGTQVLTPDGTPIEGIRSIEWEIEAGGKAYLTLVVEARADLQAAEVAVKLMREVG